MYVRRRHAPGNSALLEKPTNSPIGSRRVRKPDGRELLSAKQGIALPTDPAHELLDNRLRLQTTPGFSADSVTEFPPPPPPAPRPVGSTPSRFDPRGLSLSPARFSRGSRGGRGRDANANANANASARRERATRRSANAKRPTPRARPRRGVPASATLAIVDQWRMSGDARRHSSVFPSSTSTSRERKEAVSRLIREREREAWT